MDVPIINDHSKTLARTLASAIKDSKLSFRGHVDRAAFCLALRNYFQSKTGLRVSSVLTIGWQFELNQKCVAVLPAELVPDIVRHLATGDPAAMFATDAERVSFFEVTGVLVIDADADAIGAGAAEEDGPPANRPRCLQAGTTDTLSAGRSLSALLKLDLGANFDSIMRALRGADALALRCVGAMFDIACPGPDADRPLRREFLDRVGEAVLEVFDACAASAAAAPPRRRLPATAPAESLRDEALNEEIRRDTHMLLANVHASYRMLIKTLRARDELPTVFASLDSLPIVAVRALHLHLSTQESVRKIVLSSVQSGIAAASQSALQRDLIKRLTVPDTFLATHVARNAGTAFSPFEQMFGILSTGHLTEFAATVDYVPQRRDQGSAALQHCTAVQL
jgi:hypothetical protein